MNTQVASGPSPASWWVALAGLALLLAPVYWTAAKELWPLDEQMHGPIVLLVAAWLFWSARHTIAQVAERPQPSLGGALVGLGLLLYLLGQVFNISVFKFGAQPLLVAGVLLVLKGSGALRAVWFPVLYLIFSVPLPEIVVDTITGPLKHWISVIVEQLLHAAGYPIARAGVTMTVGQYQLLVADACSGLNSMFSLSALGTLFMYLMARKSRLHNAIMLTAILPIAFVANIVRVIILVLVTYHFGDEAGQGFLHNTAGFVLTLVALGILFALDALLVRVFPSRGTGRPAASPRPN